MTCYDLTRNEKALLSNAAFIRTYRAEFYELLSDLKLDELCERVDDECDLGRWFLGVILDWRTEVEDEQE